MASEDHSGQTQSGAEINGDLDDQDALERAIALSLQQETPGASSNPSTDTRTQVQHKAPASSSFGSLLLDRKKMEEERLSRLQKKRSATDAKLDYPPPRPNSKSSVISSLPPAQQSSEDGDAKGRTSTTPTSTLSFSKGVVKKTWVRGCPRDGSDITIEEVLDKERLELAVLSSFQWDEGWLLSKVDVARTRIMLIAFANGEFEKQAMRDNVPSSRVRFCFPPMNGPGCLHSKLQLLKFKSHLRIAVPSGNLVSYDWGETGQLENMVFLIDLPLIEDVEGRNNDRRSLKASDTAFGAELQRFLRAQHLDQSLVDSLSKYDFSETLRYRFIHTIAGNHADPSWQDTGYCGLGKAVNSLGMSTDRPVTVDYVTSSLGSLNHSYLEAMYYACQGDTGQKEYQSRQTSKPRGKARAKGVEPRDAADEAVSPWKDRFRIYFPTEKTVNSSRGGKAAAGTICFQDKWWRSPTFPRECLRDSVNRRKGVLMHDKLILVQADTSGAQDGPAWGYVGSANLSESAWGRLVKDRSSGKPKLNCRNWECGVLVPVKQAGGRVEDNTKHGAGKFAARGGEPGVFEGTIPVPLDIPSEAYGSSSGETAGDRPWLFHGRQ